MNSRRTTHTIALALIVVMVLPPMARAQTAARAENAVAAGVPASPAPVLVDLMVGRSTVIHLDHPITRVSLSTPDIADAMVTTPYEVLVHGKVPGTISLLIWGDNGKITTYDVAVRRDLSALVEQMHSQFPAETIKVAGNGKDVVLSGSVSSKYVIDRASMLAVGYVDKPENVVNLMQQGTGVATNQVLLRVRFAEVSRSAVQELGAAFFTGAAGKGDWVGRTTTQQFAAPDFDKTTGLVFSDFLNLFAFNTEEQIGAVVKALKTKGLFQSLAEPNLITQDGKEASFLAGGEYPYPVIQASSGNSAVTIVFKEFGVRLKFTPTVLADGLIHLKVAPEVSTLDFGNGLVLSGFRVPALATRRTETEVELRDGQTFAIAGLLDNTVDETMRKVPGIGDIPILGYLFKSQAYQKHATELVVMITPHLLRRDSPGVTPNLPGLVEPYLNDPGKRLPSPAPAFTTSQTGSLSAPAPSALAVPVAAQSIAAQPAPAPGAAVVKAEAAAKPVAVVKPAVVAKPAVVQSQVDTTPGKAQLKQQQTQLDAARKSVEVQTKKNGEQARVAAKAEAIRAEHQRILDDAHTRQLAAQARKDQEKADADAKVEAARLEKESKAASQRSVEQGAIDRKRMIEQQATAARLKETTDRLTKEQEKQQQVLDKAAKEQADRDAELSRLVEQYRKLTTAGQSGQ